MSWVFNSESSWKTSKMCIVGAIPLSPIPIGTTRKRTTTSSSKCCYWEGSDNKIEKWIVYTYSKHISHAQESKVLCAPESFCVLITSTVEKEIIIETLGVSSQGRRTKKAIAIRSWKSNGQEDHSVVCVEENICQFAQIVLWVACMFGKHWV